MDSQGNMLATPQHQIRRDKKSGLLVSPSKITFVGPLDDNELEQDTAHAQPLEDPSYPLDSMPQHSGREYVCRQDFDILNNQLEEK